MTLLVARSMAIAFAGDTAACRLLCSPLSSEAQELLLLASVWCGWTGPLPSAEDGIGSMGNVGPCGSVSVGEGATCGDTRPLVGFGVSPICRLHEGRANM